MTRNYKNISELKEWEKNPRTIRDDDYKLLRKNIRELGMFKPLLVMPDGVVLGGNMRLKAYREMGYTDIWVSAVDFKSEQDGFVAYLDGVRVENEKKEPVRVFKSKEEAMFIYAMADNNRAGETKKDLVTRLLSDYKISESDLDMKIDFGKATPIRELKKITEQVKSEIQFTPELLHENNYIVFTFDNVLDWQVIEKAFDIKAVKALDSKDNYFRAGIGRVVDGKKLLEKIK